MEKIGELIDRLLSILSQPDTPRSEAILTSYSLGRLMEHAAGLPDSQAAALSARLHAQYEELIGSGHEFALKLGQVAAAMLKEETQ
jgi:hypothetical protein